MAQTRPESAKARRGGGPKALADSLRKVTRQALGQRSLAEQSLILDWPSIAGGDITVIDFPVFYLFEDPKKGGIKFKSDSNALLALEPPTDEG